MTGVLNPEATAQVLRNAGIPVKTYVLARAADGTLERPYRRAADEVTGEPLLEWRYVRISNAVLAAVETPEPTGWGSVGGWETALADTPFRAIAQTLAICWGLFVNDSGLAAPDVAQAAAALVDGEIEGYSLAVANAFLMSQGVDPQRVGEHLAAEIRSLRTQREAIEEAVRKETLETEKRRADFVSKQTSPSASVADEPTPISLNLSEEALAVNSSPLPEPGFVPAEA